MGVEANVNFSDNELRDEVLRWKEKYDNAAEELIKKESELEKQRKKLQKMILLQLNQKKN